jgi:tRNA-2-methylthio-N6-dimethylallyladenosine synthase
VPYTRGAERYRSSDEIVSEIKRLCAAGVREVTLLGQTVNSWHEPHERADESRFPWLLERIAREVPELWRLRYTSPHPRHVTPALVRAHAELAVLPAHVHLPVQSGSDRMLRLMLRRYRRRDFLERAHALRQARPGFTLSTDMIVGFPGETEQDFQDTLSLVRDAGFVSVFAFKYSPRPHTPALRLGDDIPEELKSERLERLFEVSEAQQRVYLQGLVGSELEVLVEGPSKSDPTRLTGRSERHEIVHVPASSAIDFTGRLLRVRIVEANKRSLVGEPLHVGVGVEPPQATLGSTGPSTPQPARKSSLRLPVVPA